MAGGVARFALRHDLACIARWLPSRSTTSYRSYAAFGARCVSCGRCRRRLKTDQWTTLESTKPDQHSAVVGPRAHPKCGSNVPGRGPQHPCGVPRSASVHRWTQGRERTHGRRQGRRSAPPPSAPATDCQPHPRRMPGAPPLERDGTRPRLFAPVCGGVVDTRSSAAIRRPCRAPQTAAQTTPFRRVWTRVRSSDAVVRDSPSTVMLEVFRAEEGVDLIREAVKVAWRLAR